MIDDGYDDDDEQFGDIDDMLNNCGWDPVNGGCSMAGSEDCDFECPLRDEMIKSLKRKKAKVTRAK